MTAAPLAARHHAALLSLALDERASRTGAVARNQGLVDWFYEELAAGRTSFADRDRFMANALSFDFNPRPRMLEGAPLPCRYVVDARTPDEGWTYVCHLRLLVDGRPLPLPTNSAFTNGRWGGTSRGFYEVPPIGGVGRHELTFLVDVRVQCEATDETPALTRYRYVGRRELRVTRTVEVLADVPANRTAFAHDPSAAKRVRGSLNPHGFEVSEHGPTLSGEIVISSPPADLAYEAFARVKGREYPIGDFSERRGVNLGRYLSGTYAGPLDVATFDLVLRPSARAEQGDVEVLTPWDGELVFENERLYVPSKLSGATPPWVQDDEGPDGDEPQPFDD
jgi:hypothetical protein